jgi:ubiquinone biosynthesis protein COQ9
MQFEKTKAKMRDNKLLSGLFALPNALLSQIKAPAGVDRDDLPGRGY